MSLSVNSRPSSRANSRPGSRSNSRGPPSMRRRLKPSALVVETTSKIRAPMSETQVDLIREAFEFYDKNNKGRYRAADTIPVLRALGIPLTNEDIEEKVHQHNPQRNVYIEDFEKLVAELIDGKTQKMEEAEIKKAFATLAEEKAGIQEIPIEVFKNYLKTIGDTMTDEELKNIFKRFRKPTLNFEQFRDLVTVPEASSVYPNA